jgi:hypothetical protein
VPDILVLSVQTRRRANRVAILLGSFRTHRELPDCLDAISRSSGNTASKLSIVFGCKVYLCFAAEAFRKPNCRFKLMV